MPSRAASAEFPDVVLLDLGLPDADGLEVARQLRNHPSSIGVLLGAVTGFGTHDDVRRSREAGIDEPVMKPVAPELLALVDQARGGEEPR